MSRPWPRPPVGLLLRRAPPCHAGDGVPLPTRGGRCRGRSEALIQVPGRRVHLAGRKSRLRENRQPVRHVVSRAGAPERVEATDHHVQPLPGTGRRHGPASEDHGGRQPLREAMLGCQGDGRLGVLGRTGRRGRGVRRCRPSSRSSRRAPRRSASVRSSCPSPRSTTGAPRPGPGTNEGERRQIVMTAGNPAARQERSNHLLSGADRSSAPDSAPGSGMTEAPFRAILDARRPDGSSRGERRSSR